MSKTPFIQAIAPLKLEWEPYYELPDAQVGERVTVELAHRPYTAVVSAVNVEPPADIKIILPAKKTDLPPVHSREIAFWRALAQYYLCSVGEVYKAAYPAVMHRMPRVPEEETLPSAGSLEAMEEMPPQFSAVLDAFSRYNTVLLQGGAPAALYRALASKTLQEGKSVLILVPEIALSRLDIPGALVYHSGLSYVKRRAIAKQVREQEATLILGTRSALFLPHHNLGLILVHQEHDAAFKQESPAPRYHAREAAILLAGIHGAQVLLSSETPSLESLYNADNGKFGSIELKQDYKPLTRIIDTAAETRKNGMAGSFSLKLLEEMKRCLDGGKKILVICRSKAALQECTEELERIYPGNRRIVTATPASFKTLSQGSFALCAVLQADALLSKEDFRSDERTLQLLQQLRSRCSQGGLLLIQTREGAHPVFKALEEGWDAHAFLEERRVAGYPPYTRLVDITLKDKAPKRLEYMARLLADKLRSCGGHLFGPYEPQQLSPEESIPARAIRMALSRDRQLSSCKKAILQSVNSFELQYKYTGHIVVDVDPL